MNNLPRQLGVAAVTALVIGEVIAIGIFLTPATMARTVGSPLWLLIVWLVMGAMALSGALCYGALAARFPEAGGGYVYLRETFGPLVAFLYGWKCLLVMDPGITAALATGLASYVGYAVRPPSAPSASIKGMPTSGGSHSFHRRGIRLKALFKTSLCLAAIRRLRALMLRALRAAHPGDSTR